MDVKVCDALCGAGKTSACINMMNERKDDKFIFVTQFLSEVERITTACAERRFISPVSDTYEGRTKLSDIHSLMENGENIATTHALFVSYTDKTKSLIKEKGYILVLDETVDVFCMSAISKKDVDILINSKSVVDRGDKIEWIDDDYEDGDERNRFREEMMRAKSQNFLKYDDEYFFWAIPPELFTCFKESYVLTYMFEAQRLSSFFKLYNIPYSLIGTRKHEERYEFCDIQHMNRVRELRDKIHILDKQKINAIGDKRNALSFSWYQKTNSAECGANIDMVRKNLVNVFKNIWKARSSDIMWTTFKDYAKKVQNKGYGHSFVPYNKRASNEFSDRHYLAYCVNNFPRPWEAQYFCEHGIQTNGDMYALSVLIQWLFRSAIRNGEEVWIYVPSMRMRFLLTQWLDNLADGRDLDIIEYATPKRRRKQMISCENCIWSDKCRDDHICQYYESADETADFEYDLYTYEEDLRMRDEEYRTFVEEQNN